MLEDAAQAAGAELRRRARRARWATSRRSASFHPRTSSASATGARSRRRDPRSPSKHGCCVTTARATSRRSRWSGSTRAWMLFRRRPCGSALERLDDWNDRRRDAGRRVCGERASARHARLPGPAAGRPATSTTCTWSRAAEPDELAQRLERAGIDTRAYYRTPVHRQPAMERWGAGVDLPGTEQAARENLALPMGPAYGSDVGRGRVRGFARLVRPCAPAFPPTPSRKITAQMRTRLTDPVYRHRMLQLAVDALLVAAAYSLAYVLRFDKGIPQRYQDLLVDTIAFVVVGKVAIFAAFGLYQKWWRYVGPARPRVDPEGGRRREPRARRRAVRLVADRPRPAALDRGDGPAADGRAGRRRAPRRAQRRSSGRRAGSVLPKGQEVLIVGAGEAGQLVCARDAARARAAPDADRLRRRRPAQARDADPRA